MLWGSDLGGVGAGGRRGKCCGGSDLGRVGVEGESVVGVVI